MSTNFYGITSGDNKKKLYFGMLFLVRFPSWGTI